MGISMRMLILGLCCSIGSFASDLLHPIRATTPPVIDGILDEPIWQEKANTEGFRIYTPGFGTPLSEETQCFVGYDAANLFFAFRCLDRNPEKIEAHLSRRDQLFQDDWICINLDTFNDQQALIGLYVNPKGVQGDSIYANGKEDVGFDLVWESAAKIDATGYTIEVRIPLKSIRYANKPVAEMGVIFERQIARTSEKGTWPALDPAQDLNFLTQMQGLGFEGLTHPVLLEILPAVTYQRRDIRRNGSLQRDQEDEELSLTLKYGVTPKLVLDATYNPDFNQVEADAGQVDVNLRYNLFFAEKRPFFAEGSELFALAGDHGENAVPTAVHTRTIVDPTMGLKLTGRVGRKNSVASLFARDDWEDGETADFSVFRLKHSIVGDSYLGGLYTGREQDGRSNRVLGADGLLRLSQSSYVDFYALASRTEDNFDLDSDQDHAVQVNYLNGNRERDLFFALSDISEHFQIDSGYATRTGVSRLQGSYTRKYYPASESLQRVAWTLVSAQTQDKISDLWETSNQVQGRATFWGRAHFSLGYTYATEVFAGTKFGTSNGTISFDHRPSEKLAFSLSHRRGDAIYYSESPFQGRETRTTGSLTFQPSEKFNVNLSHIYYDFYEKATSQKVYDYPISRIRLTYQGNRYLFFRAIAEHNEYRKDLLTDYLASFTYIPGTVVHLGYGSFYQKQHETGDIESNLVNSRGYQETARGFFFKASYLWRR